VFAVHGVGGILGSLLVAYLALPVFGGLGLADGVTAGSQFMTQLLSVSIAVLWTGIGSYVILKVIGAVIGLRVDQQDEIEGLDLSQHGERGYHNG
jgi:Amt family ammonium transporter